MIVMISFLGSCYFENEHSNIVRADSNIRNKIVYMDSLERGQFFENIENFTIIDGGHSISFEKDGVKYYINTKYTYEEYQK